MILSRGHFQHLAVGVAALLSLQHPANAQGYPQRPVTIVVPFAAGSSPDAVARVLSPRLSELLGQQIVIENLGGAGGMIGAARIAKAPPDGYHLLFGGAGPNAVSQILSKKPQFDSRTDFAPVALIAEAPLVLVARKDLPADTLQQFLDYVKTNGHSARYGSAGAINRLSCAMLTAGLGVRVTHVPYRGGAQATQDLIVGRIDYTCPLAAVAVPQIRSGRAKAIAVLSKHRLPMLPNLATAHEQGLLNFDSSSWFAFFLPKGTPPDVVRKVHDATIATINTAGVQEQLARMGAFVVAPERRSPEYIKTFVESEIAKWTAPARAIGL